MAHYNVIQACGHEMRINLTGPHNSREWRLKHMEQKVCAACWETAQRKVAEERTAKEQWPAWTAGSERQRGWAESLRVQMLDMLADAYTTARADVPNGADAAKLATLYASGRARLIEERTDADWWIEHHTDTGRMLLQKVLGLGIEVHPDLDPRPPEQRPVPSPTPSLPPTPPPSPALILRPEHPLTETIATLRYEAETRRLSATLPEMHGIFRQTMHMLDYIWDRASVCWVRVLPASAGDPIDRLAELAHILVAAGFIVRLYDADAHARAIAGSYQAEQRRWVRAMTKGPYAGWLTLIWPRSDDLYAAANRLRGARFRDGRMFVPAGSADEVMEFAQVYAFTFSESAQQIINEIHESQAHGTVLAAPKKRTASSRRRVSGDDRVPVSIVPPALPVPTDIEIAEELADEFGDHN